MTDKLREALSDLAETQTFSADHTVWERGRQARRRAQILLVAAALALVASLGGIGMLAFNSPAHIHPADAPGDDAVPSRIMIPLEGPVEADLRVGTASAALIGHNGEPIVITAVDGVYHRLDLPGWGDPQRALTLSPDGRLLAWVDTAATPDPGMAIQVLDLTSGDVTSIPGSPSPGSPRELSWSPDSTWLGWMVDDSPASFVTVARADGSTSPRTTRLSHAMDLAIAPGGSFVASTTDGRIVRDDRSDGTEGSTQTLTLDAPGGAGEVSPDGRLLALTTNLSKQSLTLDLDTGDVIKHPFPDGTFGDAAVRPLGWLSDRYQLLLVLPNNNSDVGELVITTPEVGEQSMWRRRVGTVDATASGSLTLAVDLIPEWDGDNSLDFTHDFGDPLGGQHRPYAALTALGLLAVALGAGMIVLIRHRSR